MLLPPLGEGWDGGRQSARWKRRVPPPRPSPGRGGRKRARRAHDVVHLRISPGTRSCSSATAAAGCRRCWPSPRAPPSCPAGRRSH
ncbi:hypothetical protein GFK26_05845 [Variovorax paradoxus]|uniref:Uncharacterized protein n=1 Tax=Variovorax paradoxus TaxID=34073 RepID=A0A5Q0M167_VARPD|nr:hypothetical protein GFK26_05845 [Variovorax paradoxus]